MVYIVTFTYATRFLINIFEIVDSIRSENASMKERFVINYSITSSSPVSPLKHVLYRWTSIPFLIKW